MKIRPVSDLHMEFCDSNKEKFFNQVVPVIPDEHEQILIIAGDFDLFKNQKDILNILDIASQRFGYVIYVAGNHEFYNGKFWENFNNIKEKIKKNKNVYFLENSFVRIENVNFIGGTLWTDLSFPLAVCYSKNLNDYEVIKKENSKTIKIEDVQLRFEETKNFIFGFLENHIFEKNVVITHHAPSFKSINHWKIELNNLYASDLEDKILFTNPILWIHGHTHDSFDYLITNPINHCNTRVICNPFGYKKYYENKNFNPNFLIKIE